MLRFAKALLPILAIGALWSPGSVLAQLSSEYFGSDVVLDTVLSDSLFVAEGRIGDLSATTTYELGLGVSTVAPAMTSQFIWGSGVVYPFSLSFDLMSRIATFTVGDRTVVFTSDYTAFDAIFIRARAVLPGTSVGLYDLMLDGIPVPGTSVESGPDGLTLMQIYGSPLYDGFTLSGTTKLSWDGVLPKKSQLAFQIYTANMLIVTNEDQSWSQVKNLFR